MICKNQLTFCWLGFHVKNYKNFRWICSIFRKNLGTSFCLVHGSRTYYIKKWGRLWVTLEGVFFHVSGVKKNFYTYFFENFIAPPLKKFVFLNFSCILFLNKTDFLGLRTFSNVNVLHKGLLLQEWVFRLGGYLYIFIELFVSNLATLTKIGDPWSILCFLFIEFIFSKEV